MRQRWVALWHSTEDVSWMVLTLILLLVAQGVQSFLVNGRPGHIEWLALPDLVFPVVVLAFSCWGISRILKYHALLPLLFGELLRARMAVVLIQILIMGLDRMMSKNPAWDAFPDIVQEVLELWWLLTAMIMIGRLAQKVPFRSRVLTLCAWGVFIGPWVFWLSLFTPADLWQADGEDADPKHYAQAMSEDTFTAQSAIFESAVDDIQNERPGIEDIYFLGLAGDASSSVFRREVDLAHQVLATFFDVGGRSIILANESGNTTRYPFATHNNFESALNHMGELMDVDDDVLFLFLSSHGTKSSTLTFAQPGLIMPDLDPASLKADLDQSKIKWRIIVISACYSGGFIEALQDTYTLIIVSSDDTDGGLGCVVKDRYTWFAGHFFDDQLRKTWSIPTAFQTTSQWLNSQRGLASTIGAPQMAIGEAMRIKLSSLEERFSRPGGASEGMRAHREGPWPGVTYAGMSGVKEHSKAWMSSFNRSLRFLSRTNASSSISAATM